MESIRKSIRTAINRLTHTHEASQRLQDEEKRRKFLQETEIERQMRLRKEKKENVQRELEQLARNFHIEAALDEIRKGNVILHPLVHAEKHLVRKYHKDKRAAYYLEVGWMQSERRYDDIWDDIFHGQMGVIVGREAENQFRIVLTETDPNKTSTYRWMSPVMENTDFNPEVYAQLIEEIAGII